jgi:hypothetical protein
MRTFWWESLRGWDFSRPQLVVVSGLFQWESLDGWDFSRPQLVVVSGLFFIDGILAIAKPFSQTFFALFTMEFRLSRSLSHEFFLFSRWNFGYHGDFLTNSFFFHDGISAITEPFSLILSFFTMEFRLSRSPSFFLFSRWNFGYHGALLFLSFFTMEFRDTKYETCNLGEDSFHTYIRKSILHGIRLVKNLAS